MSKVTIGHDSCTTWTCGTEQGPSVFTEVPFDNNIAAVATSGPCMWPLATIIFPAYGIYAGAKAVSKAIRSSR